MVLFWFLGFGTASSAVSEKYRGKKVNNFAIAWTNFLDAFFSVLFMFTHSSREMQLSKICAVPEKNPYFGETRF